MTADGVDHVVACHYPLVDAEPVGMPVAVAAAAPLPADAPDPGQAGPGEAEPQDA